MARTLCREPATHLRAARAAVASDRRSAARGHVQPSAFRRRLGGFRLHLHELAEGHDSGTPLRAPDVSLRADLVELGVGDAVLLGVVRGVVGRIAKRPLGAGRRAAPPSQRQPHGGGQQPIVATRVSSALPRLAGALRAGGRADQRPSGARERRQRVGARALQDGPRSGAVAPRQPRLRQPRGVSGVRSEGGGGEERRSPRAARARARRAVPLAGAAAGQLPADRRARGLRKPDSYPSQRLLGSQPVDWPQGRGPPVRRSRGGLACPDVRGDAAATGRAGQARGQLPAHHRPVGAQARRL
jgi:hypothetical protein